jgi:hypothetical protein
MPPQLSVERLVEMRATDSSAGVHSFGNVDHAVDAVPGAAGGEVGVVSTAVDAAGDGAGVARHPSCRVRGRVLGQVLGWLLGHAFGSTPCREHAARVGRDAAAGGDAAAGREAEARADLVLAWTQTQMMWGASAGDALGQDDSPCR